ncbi:hypothetical protein GGI01_001521 [Coemansia sp. RSA 376]|nr:hypothetical protein H4S03_002309 [Coemansia sp. S3946]KAJ2262458.1 hypothetical protein GGI01_001521 [Coemansia sp. RSA 376]KAJ2469024.1 hypothetical protein GGI03_000635 [Coemansia sp. RSA 2337]
MTGIPLFLQRMGRGSMSFDEPRPNTTHPTKRHSLDMDTLLSRRRLPLLRSPKFFAKVTWVDTLSQLATMVPLSQVSIPQPVYEYNMKVESALPALSTPRQQQQQQQAPMAFGVPLEGVMTRGSNSSAILPRPVRECIAYLRHNGVATEGLFRRSPPSTVLRAAKDAYNGDQPVDLELGGVHVAAVLLKLFFRELPEPIFSSHSYATVRALPVATIDGNAAADVAKQMDSVRARYVEEVILPSLSRECRLLLCFTCALLAIVARNEESNRMTAFNLAIVWAPNLARSANPVADVAMCSAGPAAATVGSVIQIMVACFDSVFAAELATILGSSNTATDDRVVAVLDVVDRMNEDGWVGFVESTPPALPPRSVSTDKAESGSD